MFLRIDSVINRGVALTFLESGVQHDSSSFAQFHMSGYTVHKERKT